MGLIVFFVEVVFSAVLVVAMDSHYAKQEDKIPNRVYYDCCDVGLDKETKEDCGFAADKKDHILIERNGDEKVFLWSDCKIGKEPWRKPE